MGAARFPTKSESAVRTLLWFRGKDLRIADNLALSAASRGTEVVPLFVAGAELTEGAHRAQFMLESVEALAKNLASVGSGLIALRGDAVSVVPDRARRWKVGRVVALRRTEPLAREEAKQIASALHVPLTLFDGETLLPPETLRTQNGTPFSVFTPFSRCFREHADGIGNAVRAPRRLPPLPAGVLEESTRCRRCRSSE
jgi:deoxyribodipyrimidine photo-lyase